MIPSPEETMFECSKSEWLHALPLELAEQLSRLKKDKLTAFYYHIIYGLTHREIAVILNTSKKSAYRWIGKVYKVCESYKKVAIFALSKRRYSEEAIISLSEYLEN